MFATFNPENPFSIYPMDRQGIIVFGNYVVPTANIKTLMIQDKQIAMELRNPLSEVNNTLFFDLEDQATAKRISGQILSISQKAGILVISNPQIPLNLNTVCFTKMLPGEKKGPIELNPTTIINISDITLLIANNTSITMHLKKTHFVINCGTTKFRDILLTDFIRSMHHGFELKLY